MQYFLDVGSTCHDLLLTGPQDLLRPSTQQHHAWQSPVAHTHINPQGRLPSPRLRHTHALHRPQNGHRVRKRARRSAQRAARRGLQQRILQGAVLVLPRAPAQALPARLRAVERGAQEPAVAAPAEPRPVRADLLVRGALREAVGGVGIWDGAVRVFGEGAVRFAAS